MSWWVGSFPQNWILAMNLLTLPNGCMEINKMILSWQYLCNAHSTLLWLQLRMRSQRQIAASKFLIFFLLVLAQENVSCYESHTLIGDWKKTCTEVSSVISPFNHNFTGGEKRIHFFQIFRSLLYLVSKKVFSLVNSKLHGVKSSTKVSSLAGRRVVVCINLVPIKDYIKHAGFVLVSM